MTPDALLLDQLEAEQIPASDRWMRPHAAHAVLEDDVLGEAA